MASFNKVILMGRITADPELKQTPNGVSVTSFRIAVDSRYSKDECYFITIVAWRQTAEFICRYFKKGQAILVCGELQIRSWDDNGLKRHATEVVASEVSFCESKKDSEGSSYSGKPNGSQGKNEPYAYVPAAYTQQSFMAADADTDLPF